MIRSRALRLVVLAVVAAVLSGCGHRPGAAIQVGDSVVTRDTVDTMSNGYCTVLVQSGRLTSSVPRSALTWVIVNQIVAATVENAYGDHIGASYDAASLRKQVVAISAVVRKLPAKQRAVFTEQFTSIVRGDLIAVRIGTDALQKKGVSSPTDDQARTAGYQVAHAWAAKQGISIDPRYSVGRSGTAGAGDGSISVPVTRFAKGAASGSATPSFTGGLPARQLCG